MPRRDVHLTVVLGDGPNVDNSWDQGIAVAAYGNDAQGMVIGKPAGQGEDIIGWTVRAQNSGDVATLRTFLDGTIEVKIGTFTGSIGMGEALWLAIDDTGTMVPLQTGAVILPNQDSIGLALEHGKVAGELCEVYIYSQKFSLLDGPGGD